MDGLRIFPFLNSDAVIHGLKSELHQYLAAAEDVAVTIDRKGWWALVAKIQ